LIIFQVYLSVLPHLALPFAASSGVMERAQEERRKIIAIRARIFFIAYH
jgi:hypothetical protein